MMLSVFPNEAKLGLTPWWRTTLPERMAAPPFERPVPKGNSFPWIVMGKGRFHQRWGQERVARGRVKQ